MYKNVHIIWTAAADLLSIRGQVFWSRPLLHRQNAEWRNIAQPTSNSRSVQETRTRKFARSSPIWIPFGSRWTSCARCVKSLELNWCRCGEACFAAWDLSTTITVLEYTHCPRVHGHDHDRDSVELYGYSLVVCGWVVCVCGWVVCVRVWVCS